MYIIIGGVERQVNQIETYAEYMGGKDKLANKTADEIFHESRANKLHDKVLQLTFDKAALSLSQGKTISFPSIIRKPIESFEGETNYDKAVNAEIFYAEQACVLAHRRLN